MGWLPAPRRKICHFGVNPDPTGRFKAASPRTETFSRGQDPKRTLGRGWAGQLDWIKAAIYHR
jgi:hypothetical protein